MALDTPLPSTAPTLPVATPTQKSRIEKAAHDFESSFLQVMMGQMFQGVGGGSFDGGEGEAAFKSFLTDAFAKSIVKHGGVGLSKQLTNELLKMQGLSAAPAASATAGTTTGAATSATTGAKT